EGPSCTRLESVVRQPKIQVTAASVNDLTIQAATVNGSGSQTANLVLTRAIFHMGIPVAPKNVFPSNIEGLPTWYQLRITPEGHMARSDKVDILVAYNVATWREDLKTVRPGGAVIHEEAFSTLDVRGDVTYYAVPFAKLAKSTIQTDTLRTQLANRASGPPDGRCDGGRLVSHHPVVFAVRVRDRLLGTVPRRAQDR